MVMFLLAGDPEISPQFVEFASTAVLVRLFHAKKRYCHLPYAHKTTHHTLGPKLVSSTTGRLRAQLPFEVRGVYGKISITAVGTIPKAAILVVCAL